MSDLASRLDPCVNWFKLLARTKGRILWIFPAVLLAAYLVSLRHADLFGNFAQRRSELRANAPLLAEARSLNLGYEQVLAQPSAFVGKPVVWCVNTPAPETTYVSGRPSWPVALNTAFDPDDSAKDSCRDVLAVVAGFEGGRIQLRPVEKL